METFWVRAIIFGEGDTKPWLCAMTSPQFSLERAKHEIDHLKENYNVLSAWVDSFNENNEKTVVFHECYMTY